MKTYQQNMIGNEIEIRIETAEAATIREIGHLRERAALDRTLENFTSEEVLTLILSHHISPRAKFSPAQVAANLILNFGSLNAVLAARPEQLRAVPGMTDKTTEILAEQLGIIRAWTRAALDAKTRINHSDAAKTYCASLLQGERVEKFYVIALNAQCYVQGTRCIATGSLSEVSAYPRLVLETALNLNAHSVLFAHNHPGGTMAPSAEDIASTVQLQRLLNAVGIMVLDHIIVTDAGTYSMIQHGDIDYRIKR